MLGRRTRNSNQAHQLPGCGPGGSEPRDGGRETEGMSSPGTGGVPGRALRVGATRVQAWDGRRAGNLNRSRGPVP